MKNRIIAAAFIGLLGACPRAALAREERIPIVQAHIDKLRQRASVLMDWDGREETAKESIYAAHTLDYLGRAASKRVPERRAFLARQVVAAQRALKAKFGCFTSKQPTCDLSFNADHELRRTLPAAIAALEAVFQESRSEAVGRAPDPIEEPASFEAPLKKIAQIRFKRESRDQRRARRQAVRLKRS